MYLARHSRLSHWPSCSPAIVEALPEVTSLPDRSVCRLSRRLPQIPVDEVAAAAVQNAAQVVERPADVDMGNIDVPVFVRRQRLIEARALLRY
jgi:hypothetical protein